MYLHDKYMHHESLVIWSLSDRIRKDDVLILGTCLLVYIGLQSS